MNKLVVKTKIECATCGCSMSRKKSFRVEADTQFKAVSEVTRKIISWKEKLKNQDCKVCKSIKTLLL